MLGSKCGSVVNVDSPASVHKYDETKGTTKNRPSPSVRPSVEFQPQSLDELGSNSAEVPENLVGIPVTEFGETKGGIMFSQNSEELRGETFNLQKMLVGFHIIQG